MRAYEGAAPPQTPGRAATLDRGVPAVGRALTRAIDEHIVEILSDSGEGAQRCGQSFAAIAARSGLGI